MATYLDLYAATRSTPSSQSVADANLSSARHLGYTDAGVRRLFTSMFSATR
ncbi:MAG: hypothetical protein AAFQ35_07540 [Pseudomonadota bacterium]